MGFIDVASIIRSDRSPPGGKQLSVAKLDKLTTLCEGRQAAPVVTGNSNEVTPEGIEPNWRSAALYARELLEESADLAVLLRLSMASLRTHSVESFVECLEAIAVLADAHWEEIYPELFAEDGSPPDAGARVGILAQLDVRAYIAIPLLQAPVRVSEAGERWPNLLDVAGGVLPVTGGDNGRATMLLSKALVERSLAAIGRLEEAVSRHSPADRDFQLASLKETLNGLLVKFGKQRPDDSPVEADLQAESIHQAEAGMPAAGRVASREQAIRSLEQLIRYFETAEPSSPVPSILRRAKKLVGKDFWEVIQELGDQRLSDAVTESKLFPKQSS